MMAKLAQFTWEQVLGLTHHFKQQNLACAYHTGGVFVFGEQINAPKLMSSTSHNQSLIKIILNNSFSF